MRKIHFILLLACSMILVACSEEVVKQVQEKTEKEIGYAKLLTKDEAKEQKETKSEKKIKKKDEKKEIKRDVNEVTNIVRRNLSDIENHMPNYWDLVDGGDALQLIEQMHLTRPDNDNKQQKELLADAEKRLKDDLAAESLKKLARYFLINGHASMHKDYVHVGDMHARYTVSNEKEDRFDFTFITLDDAEAGFAIPGETTLTYQYDGKWRLADIVHRYPNEKALHLTFNDLEEYYTDFMKEGMNFRPIEEEKINGVTYLTYQIGDYIQTRNAETSMVEYID